MNKTWALTRILLKNGTGSSSKTGLFSRLPRRFRFLLGAAFLAAVFSPLALLVGNLFAKAYEALEPIGQETAVLGFGLVLAQMAVFVFGIFYVITVYYFARDVEHLLPLPLKPAQIVTAKFLTVLLYEYATQLILLGPLFVVYFAKSGSGPLFLIYAAIVFAAAPVIPLVLASIVAMAIMSLAGGARNKDRFRTFGGIVAVLAVFAAQLGIRRIVDPSMSPEQLQELLLGGDLGLLELATRSFPGARLAANALAQSSGLSGLAWLALFAASSALAYAVFAALAQRFYFRGVIGMSEMSARRIRLSGHQLDKRTVRRSALGSLLAKELRILLRTPPFFLNCVLMALMWPVLMLVPVLASPDFGEMLGSAKTLLGPEGVPPIVPAIGAALFLFVSGANSTAPTSVSREGAAFIVAKYLPVPRGTMIAAKVLSGWIVTMAGALLILLTASILFGLPVPFALAMLPIAAAASLFSCLTGVMLDLWMPKLVWDNEQRAVKQNMNSLFNLLLCFAAGALLFFMAQWSGLGPWGAAGLLLSLLAAMDALLFGMLKKNGPEWLDRIEI